MITITEVKMENEESSLDSVISWGYLFLYTLLHNSAGAVFLALPIENETALR